MGGPALDAPGCRLWSCPWRTARSHSPGARPTGVGACAPSPARLSSCDPGGPQADLANLGGHGLGVVDRCGRCPTPGPPERRVRSRSGRSSRPPGRSASSGAPAPYRRRGEMSARPRDGHPAAGAGPAGGAVRSSSLGTLGPKNVEGFGQSSDQRPSCGPHGTRPQYLRVKRPLPVILPSAGTCAYLRFCTCVRP
jgi:hypothetical protein